VDEIKPFSYTLLSLDKSSQADRERYFRNFLLDKYLPYI